MLTLVSFPNSSGIHVRTHRMEENSRCCTAGSRGENTYWHQAVNSQFIITLTQYLPCLLVFLQISMHSIVKESSNLSSSTQPHCIPIWFSLISQKYQNTIRILFFHTTNRSRNLDCQALQRTKQQQQTPYKPYTFAIFHFLETKVRSKDQRCSSKTFKSSYFTKRGRDHKHFKKTKGLVNDDRTFIILVNYP